MNIEYTPERIAFYEELERRRYARYQRKLAQIARERRQERILGAVKTALGYLLGVAVMLAYLFASAFWASC